MRVINSEHVESIYIVPVGDKYFLNKKQFELHIRTASGDDTFFVFDDHDEAKKNFENWKDLLRKRALIEL